MCLCGYRMPKCMIHLQSGGVLGFPSGLMPQTQQWKHCSAAVKETVLFFSTQSGFGPCRAAREICMLLFSAWEGHGLRLSSKSKRRVATILLNPGYNNPGAGYLPLTCPCAISKLASLDHLMPSGGFRLHLSRYYPGRIHQR